MLNQIKWKDMYGDEHRRYGVRSLKGWIYVLDLYRNAAVAGPFTSRQKAQLFLRTTRVEEL